MNALDEKINHVAHNDTKSNIKTYEKLWTLSKPSSWDSLQLFIIVNHLQEQYFILNVDFQFLSNTWYPNPAEREQYGSVIFKVFFQVLGCIGGVPGSGNKGGKGTGGRQEDKYPFECGTCYHQRKPAIPYRKQSPEILCLRFNLTFLFGACTSLRRKRILSV